MLETVLKLGQFVTDKFGVPGAMAVGLVVYLAYALREERLAHEKTRDQIGLLNDKRLELLTTYLKAMQDFKEKLEAILSKVTK